MGKVVLDMDDEITRSILVTRDGEVVHEGAAKPCYLIIHKNSFVYASNYITTCIRGCHIGWLHDY